ncbi:MAG TPA: hypothetical protein VK116_01250, partial [Planctomycetota bacterium]|nr:hypothetical protein [Planctomycetota bacterium]
MIWRYLLAIGLSLLVLFIFQSRHRDAVVEDAGRAPDRKVAVEGEPAETIDATPASGPVEFAWGPSGIETATVPAGAGDAASTVLLRAT